jgi:formylglycine-generating enzyme required for sulfatase activity
MNSSIVALSIALATASSNTELNALRFGEDVMTSQSQRSSQVDSAPRSKTAVRAFRECSEGCPEMVEIPSGQFLMGSRQYSREQPQHGVQLDNALAVARYEATFDDWDACVKDRGCAHNKSPSDEGWGRGRRPVINVSWEDAKDYAAWLSQKTGQKYRLLNEAEWEYVRERARRQHTPGVTRSTAVRRPMTAARARVARRTLVDLPFAALSRSARFTPTDGAFTA